MARQASGLWCQTTCSMAFMLAPLRVMTSPSVMHTWGQGAVQLLLPMQASAALHVPGLSMGGTRQLPCSCLAHASPYGDPPSTPLWSCAFSPFSDGVSERPSSEGSSPIAQPALRCVWAQVDASVRTRCWVKGLLAYVMYVMV